MKKQLILILITFIFSSSLYSQIRPNKMNIGNRFHIISSSLEEEREFQVYLPATYYFSDKNNYPVIYLLDGDYNFHYVTGLVELLSNVSGKVPECIIVGIADKGAKKYRNNCTPNQIKERNGNANNYMNFIQNELKPFVQNKFRTANFDILIGHSIGGLFVTNFSIEKPNSFNAYIAIDPALWLGDFEIISRANKTFKKQLNSLYYISSSNAQGMGIDKYVKILNEQFPEKQKWKYFKFENENHNSVGLLTIKQSLENIFTNWSISEEEFKSFKSANEVVNHYIKLSEKFSSIVSIHPYFLGNIVYFYFNRDKKEDLLILENEIKKHFPGSIAEFYNQLALNHFEKKEYENALNYYNKSIDNNPLSFYAYDGISKVYLSQKNIAEAIKASEKSISIAKSCNARQWMINQLNSNLMIITKLNKE